MSVRTKTFGVNQIYVMCIIILWKWSYRNYDIFFTSMSHSTILFLYEIKLRIIYDFFASLFFSHLISAFLFVWNKEKIRIMIFSHPCFFSHLISTFLILWYRVEKYFSPFYITQVEYRSKLSRKNSCVWIISLKLIDQIIWRR